MKVAPNPFSSAPRPVLAGERGAVSAAHPSAAAAGQSMLMAGGSAVDALIAAQAVLAVVAPEACGLGGDAFVLLRDEDGTIAVNGAGAAPAAATGVAADGARSVTVPGLVDAWCLLAPRGRLGLAAALTPAIRLAREGCRADAGLVVARDAQADRLRAGGGEGWSLMGLAAGDRFVQPALAATLERIADAGRDGFYAEQVGEEMLARLGAGGSAMAPGDLAAPSAFLLAPLVLDVPGGRLSVQPPASQGVLLAMALQACLRGGRPTDHLAVEATQAAFAHRDEVGRGVALLDEPLEIDPGRAGRRGGPRAYLHTAGVAVADAWGNVASSLVSVFDDFGSGVFLPRAGFVLNNRGGGFTGGGNAFAPGARPVHTLAPAILEMDGTILALSTPGADGQVQTLLQVILALLGGADLADAVAAPRWRSEDGRLLVEAGHPARDDLAARGHDVVDVGAGDMRFGAITAAGLASGTPVALADWRRTTWAGTA